MSADPTYETSGSAHMLDHGSGGARSCEQALLCCRSSQADQRPVAPLDAPLSCSIKQVCAHWLTWRRVQLMLTPATIARRLGISRQNMLLLEFGLAGPTLLTSVARGRLSETLASAALPSSATAAVLAAALGELHALDQAVLATIRADLVSAPLLSQTW